MLPKPESILFPTAWTSEAAGPGAYQLVVQSVRLSSGAAQEKATIELVSQGFVVKWADPPLGAETNAMWTGSMVPFEVVQRLLKAVVNQQIPPKKIQYRYRFQSTPNPTEIRSDRRSHA